MRGNDQGVVLGVVTRIDNESTTVQGKGSQPFLDGGIVSTLHGYRDSIGRGRVTNSHLPLLEG